MVRPGTGEWESCASRQDQWGPMGPSLPRPSSQALRPPWKQETPKSRGKEERPSPHPELGQLMGPICLLQPSAL